MPMLVEIEPGTGRARPSDANPDAVPLAPAETWRPDSGDGLLLAIDAEPEQRFAAASVIAIEFPIFHDGRGLSLAVLLRTRVGFTGELRAVGDIHPDLLHYFSRCGFDSCLLPDGRSLPASASVEAPYTDFYQGSVVEAAPAFRRGRRTA
jgi:uncharacterized protein (DUF934 family)